LSVIELLGSVVGLITGGFWLLQINLDVPSIDFLALSINRSFLGNVSIGKVNVSES